MPSHLIPMEQGKACRPEADIHPTLYNAPLSPDFAPERNGELAMRVCGH